MSLGLELICHWKDGLMEDAGVKVFVLTEERQCERDGKRYRMKLGQVDHRRGQVNYHEVEEVPDDDAD